MKTINKFERYLIDNGIQYKGAGKYRQMADKFLNWCRTSNLKVASLKRSQITDYLQLCREQGNKETTIRRKENVLQHYYRFLGTKTNPATTWIQQKKEHTLPPRALEKQELMNMYLSLHPHSPVGYRDRCIIGLIVFQGLLRSELWELRISDIDFQGEVLIQGQLRTNSRKLKLEPVQLMHLYDYFHKYRNEFLCTKHNKETDRFFLSKGVGEGLNNVATALLKNIKRNFPQIIDFRHIRTSVITHWEKQDGIIEAMQKAGHRYISSTQRYQTNKYEELQEQLKNMHPLERMNISNI
jgi:integrase/recombinase XerD